MSSHTKGTLLSARHRRAIILSIMAAAALYLGVVIINGYEQAKQVFIDIGWLGWLLLCTASFASYLLRYTRWQYYMRVAGWRIPHGLHFLYYLAGFALTTTPGKAGETIRSVLLRPHGIPYHTSLACFFTERLLDVVVVTLLAGLILTSFTEHRGLIVIFGMLLLVALPLLHSSYPSRTIGWLQRRFQAVRLRHLLGHLARLLTDARDFLAPTRLYKGLTLGLCAWTLQGCAFYYILVLSGMEISLALALGIYALSLLAGAASMLPGGLGSTELAMGLLLAASGADQAVVLTVPIVSRLGTLWFAVLLGLLATGLLSARSSVPMPADSARHIEPAQENQVQPDSQNSARASKRLQK